MNFPKRIIKDYWNIGIAISERRLTQYLPETDQFRYRLIGTQIINGMKYIFDEIVIFNNNGKIVYIENLANIN